jgi:hypothetical protein
LCCRGVLTVKRKYGLDSLEGRAEGAQAGAPGTPRVLGVARVFQQPAMDETMRPDNQVEAIGMEVGMAWGRAQSRRPEDVSDRNLGYDMRSEGPDGAVRPIEVKARATTGSVVVTGNERLMAQRLRVVKGWKEALSA